MRKEKIGIPWWSSGKDSVLLLLGAQVQSLVTKLRICKLWAKKKPPKNPEGTTPYSQHPEIPEGGL